MFHFLSTFIAEFKELSDSFHAWKHTLVSQQPPDQDMSVAAVGVATTEGVADGGDFSNASICSVLLGVQRVMSRHQQAVAVNEGELLYLDVHVRSMMKSYRNK